MNKIKLNKKWKSKNGKYKCPFCQSEYSKMGICSHIWRAHSKNGKEFDKNRTKETKMKMAWNRGLTEETDERVRRRAETHRENLRTGKTIHNWIGRKHTEETKQKISKALSKNNHGGRCKWYKVKGVYVQGTWERDLARHMSFIGVKWKKIKTNSYTLEYVDNKKKRRYTPDFLVEDKYLLEVKGFYWGDDKRKMKLVLEQNDVKIAILEKDLFSKLLETKGKNDFMKRLGP